MSNFFSTPAFLQAATDVLFPGGEVTPATVEVEGVLFDVLLRKGRRAAFSPLIDFFEPRGPDQPRPERVVRVAGLPAVSRSAVPVEGPASAALGSGDQLVAPFIDWSTFGSWEAFVSQAGRRDWNAFGKVDRKLRKIHREVGPVRFSVDESDHVLLERMLLWKAQQLRRSHRLDHFASARNRQLLHRLLDERVLKLAVFFAGERALAMQLGHVGSGRYSCWISTYDPVFASCSPGTLLLEQQMKASWERRDAEFDFLAGNEAYKYVYATHQRLVGSIGHTPLASRVLRQAKRRVDRAADVDHSPVAVQARKLATQLLHARLQRERLAPGAAAPWQELIQLDNEAWPSPRLEPARDCQLLEMIEAADAEAGTLARASAWCRISARRAGGAALRRLRRWRRPTPSTPKPAKVPELQVGDYVRVKSTEAIQATLVDGSLNGLYFIRGVQGRFGGQTFKVHRRVTRFLDEKDRRVVKSRGTVLLEDVRCDGSQIGDARGCDRGCLLFWHESWLEPVSAPERAVAAPEPAGERVRIKPLSELMELSQAASPGGVRFVPSTMSAFAGGTYRVNRRSADAYDERLGRVFALPGAMTLDGVYCPGVPLTSGGTCDRACALLWREEWVERIG